MYHSFHVMFTYYYLILIKNTVYVQQKSNIFDYLLTSLSLKHKMGLCLAIV
jgi:hypothetical protein